MNVIGRPRTNSKQKSAIGQGLPVNSSERTRTNTNTGSSDIDTDQLGANAKKLGAYCATHPDTKLIAAAGALFERE
jgi:hypothetical protein